MSIRERVLTEGTPLIDDGGATFVWLGERAPLLVGDWNGWGGEEKIGEPLTEVEPGVWTYRLALPQDAYIEYGFEEARWRRPDPYNLRELYNGVEATNNFFAMPAWRESDAMQRRVGVPAGTVKQLGASGGGWLPTPVRGVTLYRPPVEGPVPLMVVFDGREYLLNARLPVIVDNLIAEGKMQPIALAMVENGSGARMVEYLNSEATVGFLVTELLPLAAKELPLLDIERHPGAFGVMGASLGGLISLYVALRLPHLLGRVICQSGGFGLDLPKTRNLIFDLVRRAEEKPRSLWMDVGRYEWLRESNEHMRAVLAASGYAFSFRTYNAGHNYTAWRNELPMALSSVWARPAERGAAAAI